MTPAQRTRYFKHHWPDACAANGWNTRDEGRRKMVTAECMAAIAGPQTDSTSDLREDEVTALFCYLEHLAAPDDLDKSARWVDCQQDYRAYNRARQADWHERSLYGKRPNKLDRDRFDGETSAVGGPLERFDPEAIHKRHLTMASRHQKKLRAEGKATKAAKAATPAPATQPPANRMETPAPAPAGVIIEDEPF